MRKAILTAFILVLFNSLFGQTEDKYLIFSNKSIIIETKLQYGFIFPHHVDLRYFIKKHIPSFQINIGIPSSGKEIWQQIYKYPVFGIGYYHANLGNPKILGNVNSLYFFINGKLFSYKKISLDYNLETGLAHLTKCFDEDYNHNNFAVSTKFNIHAGLYSHLCCQINEQTAVKSGFGLTHYSNGALNMPNLGINVISYSFSVNYMFGSKNYNKTEKQIEKYDKSIDFEIVGSAGIRETLMNMDKKYFISSLSCNVGYNLGYISRLAVGIDVFYEEIARIYFEVDSVSDYKKSDFIHYGFYIGHNLKFGRTHFIIQQGFYAFTKFSHYENIYQRFGLRYRFNYHIIANISLVTYFARAKFVEWGIGVYF